MRIVGGDWRGRSFDAPEGRGTRPTTDRMRETIASMALAALGLDLSDVSVLDAFAGSGGVGLELLSRGARHCTFCERDPRAAALVKRNCKALGAVPSDYRVIRSDVFRLADGIVGAPFGLVFLDPPYAMDADHVAALVGGWDAAGMLSRDCLVVYERAAKAPQMSLTGFCCFRTRTHGSTSVDLLRREDLA